MTENAAGLVVDVSPSTGSDGDWDGDMVGLLEVGLLDGLLEVGLTDGDLDGLEKVGLLEGETLGFILGAPVGAFPYEFIRVMDSPHPVNPVVMAASDTMPQ